MIDLKLEVPNMGKFNYFNNGVDGVLSFNTGTTINILQQTQIMNPNYAKNVLDMYSFIPVGRDGTAKVGSFQHSKHNLRSRDNSCTWNPNGDMTFGVETIPICAKQYQNEMCSSVLFDTCWERLLGIGNDIYDFEATPEGAKFLKLAIDEIFNRIGNDYFNVVEYSNHPNIALSNTNNSWLEAGTTAKDWTAFKLQQLDSNCSGIWTSAEKLKTVSGFDHYNVPIYDNEVEGKKFIGDAIDLFDRAIEKSTPELKAWTNQSDNDLAMPIIHVSSGIFAKYKEQLRSMHNGIPAGLMLMLKGVSGISMPSRNVLQYDGYWVVERLDWNAFDAITGITSHVIAITAPRVLGITADVPPRNYEGMGMKITHRDGAPFNKTYFEATFKTGGVIIDHRFMTYGSKFLVPTV